MHLLPYKMSWPSHSHVYPRVSVTVTPSITMLATLVRFVALLGNSIFDLGLRITISADLLWLSFRLLFSAHRAIYSNSSDTVELVDPGTSR